MSRRAQDKDRQSPPPIPLTLYCSCYYLRPTTAAALLLYVCVMLTWRARETDGRTARTSCVDGTELDDGADRRWRRVCRRRRLPQGRPQQLGRRALRNRDAASFARPVISSVSGGSAGIDLLHLCLFVLVCTCLCLFAFVCARARPRFVPVPGLGHFKTKFRFDDSGH